MAPTPPFTDAVPARSLCQIINLGVVDYRRAWDMQVQAADAVRDGRQPNTLHLLEHPPVFTKGRLSPPEHLRLTTEQLACLGASVVETDRGGQVTFHGPGQLVAYPVVNLRDWGGPLKYVRTLEQVIIHSLADFGIQGGLIAGLTGVWVDGAKIAAIGVKISRGVAYHGFALNITTGLAWFQHIVPCGIQDRGVASMLQALGHAPDPEAVRYSVAYHFGQQMGFRMVEVEPARAIAAYSCTAENPPWPPFHKGGLGGFRQ